MTQKKEIGGEFIRIEAIADLCAGVFELDVGHLFQRILVIGN